MNRGPISQKVLLKVLIIKGWKKCFLVKLRIGNNKMAFTFFAAWKIYDFFFKCAGKKSVPGTLFKGGGGPAFSSR